MEHGFGEGWWKSRTIEIRAQDVDLLPVGPVRPLGGVRVLLESHDIIASMHGSVVKSSGGRSACFRSSERRDVVFMEMGGVGSISASVGIFLDGSEW
jgi:hypothetical protein